MATDSAQRANNPVVKRTSIAASVDRFALPTSLIVAAKSRVQCLDELGYITVTGNCLIRSDCCELAFTSPACAPRARNVRCFKRLQLLRQRTRVFEIFGIEAFGATSHRFRRASSELYRVVVSTIAWQGALSRRVLRSVLLSSSDIY